jgi:hypothetical protein
MACHSKGTRTGNWTLRKQRSRAGRKTGQNGDLERHTVAVFHDYESLWRHRTKATIRPEAVERTRNSTAVTMQVLFRGPPSPLFVRGCG